MTKLSNLKNFSPVMLSHYNFGAHLWHTRVIIKYSLSTDLVARNFQGCKIIFSKPTFRNVKMENYSTKYVEKSRNRGKNGKRHASDASQHARRRNGRKKWMSLFPTWHTGIYYGVTFLFF